MRFPLLPLLLLGTLSAASATSNPAPLNGIWTLTSLSEAVPSGPAKAARATGDLVILNGQIHGTVGCGRYQGTLDAAQNEVSIQAKLLPPRANERCLYVVRGALLDDLNEAQQYTLSRTHLVLFSKTSRLVFERIGYVTPARK